MQDTWQPMSANPFPWNHKDIIVAAFNEDDPDEVIVDIFRCRCGEHGAYFPKERGMLSLNEQGWIPFAWKPDDTPQRDDVLYRQLCTSHSREVLR